MHFTWKIGGEAGFGILTSGLVFSKIANRLGLYTFDFIEYPSLIRGGHNALEVVVSDTEANSLKAEVDYLICLNEQTLTKHKHRLSAQACVIYDPDDFKIKEEKITKIAVPFKKFLSDLKGQPVMKNTIAMGASLAILGSDLQILNEILTSQFSRKGQEVVDFNKKFAELGFNQVKQNYAQLIKPLLIKKESTDKHLIMSGNDAFSLGAVIGDCRLYCAYPMTPSSSVLATLASWQEKLGMVVRHAEDEIAVINTAIGASFMGARSAVGTSGGGFALMAEAISLAGITETPVVIFLSQRPGPATGMPTWTEQGDLLFACFSGHGEFPKIVLAPGSVEEMVEITAKAFNLADIYQTPVIVMSDMFLSESHKTISKTLLDKLTAEFKVDRGKIITEAQNSNVKSQNFLRYKITDDGISPRLIPGVKGHFYQSNSYEHLEDGHTTEEAQPRINQVDKRNKKTETYLKNHFESPKVFGDLNKSEMVFVSWGSTRGPIIEAQKILKTKGTDTALISFSHLYPLDKNRILPLFKNGKRYILVENNSHGQFGKLLAMETGIEIMNKLLKYDGRPFWPEEIVEKLT